MPLRDHFRPTSAKKRGWTMLHGGWPMVIVQELTKKLPAQYVAGPNIYSAGGTEVDIGTFEKEETTGSLTWNATANGNLATAMWSPPTPSLDVARAKPEQDEYEVQVYDEELGRLVAAIEIVSPANKDRPESRRAFVTKCAALLNQQVSVAIVDIVTTRRANLYRDLLDHIGVEDPSITCGQDEIYAAECRWIGENGDARIQTWSHVLAVGQLMPTLPLWLSEKLAISLELEANYEKACQDLRIA